LCATLAAELIYDDGSFSQHSTNYHRLMLHDYLWAIRLGEAAGHPLPAEVTAAVRKAGIWLRTIISPETGRVPNLGANDGAHLLDLTDLGYLDYRPTVQAVGLITDKRRWLGPGPWDELAAWLGAAAPPPLAVVGREGHCRLSLRESSENPEPPPFVFLADGGYAVWRRGATVAMLRCPLRFCHRPAHCDLLHFDLSSSGRNLLRDGGSYGYHCEEPWLGYFAGSEAHNTVRFDGRDPMPKLSRFLYGAWPRGQVVRRGEEVSASYRDYRGVRHRRTVRPVPRGFAIEDRFSGRFREAVLRWRLDPGLEWKLTGEGCRSAAAELRVRALDGGIAAIGLAQGWESLYYQERSPLPVLEVRIAAHCRAIVTEIEFPAESDLG
jgi:hypothetical protein